MSSTRKTQAGFTLIEMIVSLAIFSIIVTMTIGALLVLIANNQKLQSEQSVMTNLSFALDSMTREIRTGTNYYCDDSQNDNGNNNIFNPSNNIDTLYINGTQSCEGGRQNNRNYQGIMFTEAGDSITGAGNRILYFFDQSSTTNKMIKRRVGNGAAQPIVSSGLEIINAEFFVSGAEPRSLGPINLADLAQPTVTIHIIAKEIDNSKLYYLQTTVTQRTLDL